MTISVVLADDQALIRGALAALLSMEDDIDVVDDVGRGDDAVECVLRHAADVALLDIEMPGLTGIEAAAELRKRAPKCRTLLVTTFGRPGYVKSALAAGASGFIVKDSSAEELAAAVRAVHRGELVVDPVLAAESMRMAECPLTDRECDVLRASEEGATVKAMSSRLHLSAGTVRNYISSAMSKTGTSTRVEAAKVARDAGWL